MILLALSAAHVVIVVVALLLLFGGKKIPEVAKGLGEGIRNFKNSLKGDDTPDDKKPA
jgi:sec-independent protein translocase protein TatA